MTTSTLIVAALGKGIVLQVDQKFASFSAGVGMSCDRNALVLLNLCVSED